MLFRSRSGSRQSPHRTSWGCDTDRPTRRSTSTHRLFPWIGRQGLFLAGRPRMRIQMSDQAHRAGRQQTRETSFHETSHSVPDDKDRLSVEGGWDFARQSIKDGRQDSSQILTPSAVFPCVRSEEHTSELQSQAYLVCRRLLEKKNTNQHSQRAD